MTRGFFGAELLLIQAPIVRRYSPDALATQQEFLLALRAQHTMHDEAMPAMAVGHDNLVASARKRLELWDISDQQIDEVGRTGTRASPRRRVTRSPGAGSTKPWNACASG